MNPTSPVPGQRPEQWSIYACCAVTSDGSRRQSGWRSDRSGATNAADLIDDVDGQALGCCRTINRCNLPLANFRTSFGANHLKGPIVRQERSGHIDIDVRFLAVIDDPDAPFTQFRANVKRIL